MAGQWTRRNFLSGASAGAAALALAGRVRAATGRRPNILFIMTDDHAAHALSCYGSRINRTPNLDRLAAGGMRFDNCFCTNSLCGPSRAVILTGKFSHLNGFRQNGDRFDGEQQTLPKLLQAAGYQTAMIGKWHLASDPTGFDHWDVLPGQGKYHDPDFLTPVGRVRREGYVTDIITDLTLDWLKQRATDKPFLCCCHHKAPHREWSPAPRHRDLFRDETIPEPATLHDDYATRSDAARQQEMTIAWHLNKADLKGDVPPEGMGEIEREKRNYQIYIKDYLRCVQAVDESVGRLLDYLDEAGLADNTIVVYTSDQGFYLGDHGWFDKRFMYEPSLRSPLLVRYPGVVEPGSVNTDLTQNLDFAQTFLDYAGAPLPDDMQGASLRPLLEGRTPADWRDAVYYHYYEFPAVHQVKRHYGVRTKQHKLIHFYHDIDAWELYDLERDPDELRNVIDDPAYAPVVARLKARLEALRAQYKDTTGPADVAAARHPDFPRLVNMAVAEAEGGYLLTATGNALALRPLAQPYTRRLTLKATVQSPPQTGTRNGLLVFGDGPAEARLSAAGVYIGAGQYVILDQLFGGGGEVHARPAQFDKDKVFEVTVEVDLAARRVKLTVDGTVVEAPLKPGIERISWVGYEVHNTRTRVSRLEVEGE